VFLLGCYIAIYIELVVGYVTSDISIADKNNALAVFVAACGLLLLGSFSEMGVRGVFPVTLSVGVLFGYARICASFLEVEDGYYRIFLSDWRWALLSYLASAIAQSLVSNRFARLYRGQLIAAFYPHSVNGKHYDPSLDDLFIEGFDSSGTRTVPHLYVNTTAGGIGKRRDPKNTDPLSNLFTERYRAFVFSDRHPKGRFIMDDAHLTLSQKIEQESQAGQHDKTESQLAMLSHRAMRSATMTNAQGSLIHHAPRPQELAKAIDDHEFKQTQARRERRDRLAAEGKYIPWLTLSRAMALSGAAISTSMGSEFAWLKGKRAREGGRGELTAHSSDGTARAQSSWR
jgi:hypothetical protein